MNERPPRSRPDGWAALMRLLTERVAHGHGCVGWRRGQLRIKKMDFAELLRLYRRRTKLSQAGCAAKLGISRTYLSRIERGNSNNISWNLGMAILRLNSDNGHQQIRITVPRQIWVDASIAQEILWLNEQGVMTEASCREPPSALIKPSSVRRATGLGYFPIYREDIELFEIELKSVVEK